MGNGSTRGEQGRKAGSEEEGQRMEERKGRSWSEPAESTDPEVKGLWGVLGRRRCELLYEVMNDMMGTGRSAPCRPSPDSC